MLISPIVSPLAVMSRLRPGFPIKEIVLLLVASCTQTAIAYNNVNLDGCNFPIPACWYSSLGEGEAYQEDHTPDLCEFTIDGEYLGEFPRGSRTYYHQYGYTATTGAGCSNEFSFMLNDFYCYKGSVWNDDLQVKDCIAAPTPPTPEFGPENNGQPKPPCLGDPINAGTGNSFQQVTDFQGTSVFSLSFQRYHNSDASIVNTRLGETWRHNYDRSIISLNASTVEAHRADGKILQFTLTGSTWSSDADVIDRLEAITDGWRYTTADDTTEDYDSNGTLIAITNRAGQSHTLSYDLTAAQGGDNNSATLDKVTGPFGRTLTFSYDYRGRIVTMTDPAGNDYSYSYDVNRNLATVTYPGNTQRLYQYEDSNFPYALTGITDENGDRTVTWAYDSQGRAVLSERNGGAERVDIVYNADGTTTATDSFGNVQTYHFEVINGVVNANQIDGDHCSTCSLQYQSTTYDASGFVASRTDFNGNLTTYINDARGLELSRTEAVGTPEERTITTEWHPDFRVPTKITEPGKITTFTYDTQGRLVERNEEVAP